MVPRIDGFEPLIAALSTNAEQYFGDGRAVLRPVARLEGPFSSLLRLSVEGPSRQYHAFVKIFKPRQAVPYEEPAETRQFVECEYDATLRLHTALSGHPGLMAPRPIAVFPDHLAIVTEEVEGAPFDTLLSRAGWRTRMGSGLAEVAARIGSWIRAFQTISSASGHLSLAEQRSYVDDRLRYLTPRILSEQERAEALGIFDQLAGDVSPAVQPFVAIHADLCPTNILVTPDGGVTVLDFAMANSGTRFHDLTHLFLHFEFLRWRPRPYRRFVSDLQTALVRGFDPGASTSDPLFRLMLLQHVVCHVTLLADRAHGRFEQPIRSFVRWRWRKCLTMPALRIGRLARAGAAA
jgi:phosphotransferase family enzyme